MDESVDGPAFKSRFVRIFLAMVEPTNRQLFNDLFYPVLLKSHLLRTSNYFFLWCKSCKTIKKKKKKYTIC